MKVLKNIMTVVLAILVGSAVNMGLITLGPMLIPPPDGIDITTQEGLEKAAPLMEFRHFIFPFLAHALGTFVGAIVAYLMAAERKAQYAWSIAFVFLIGGAMNIFMIPAPIWMHITDILLAYLPMSWLAIKILEKKSVA